MRRTKIKTGDHLFCSEHGSYGEVLVLSDKPWITGVRHDPLALTIDVDSTLYHVSANLREARDHEDRSGVLVHHIKGKKTLVVHIRSLVGTWADYQESQAQLKREREEGVAEHEEAVAVQRARAQEVSIRLAIGVGIPHGMLEPDFVRVSLNDLEDLADLIESLKASASNQQEREN